MKVLRTPDERLRDLPGYPFAPNYFHVPDGRVPLPKSTSLYIKYGRLSVPFSR